MRRRTMRRFVRVVAALLICAGTAAPAAPAETLSFSSACTSGERITIAAVGDLLFHKLLQLQAYARGGDFKRFFAPLADTLESADILYGNLEGPAARGVGLGGRERHDPGRVLDGVVYSAHLASLNFNYHPSVVADLKAVGFDVVSTANNHALDRGGLGIDRTIDALEEAGLAFTGTRRRGEYERPWSVVTRAKGFAVAWVACTYALNGLPDREGQVLACYEHRDEVLREIARRAEQPGIDAVILVPHWGVQGSHRERPRQRELAHAAIEAGALAVIGTHPHVLQPWEKYAASDGREGLIVYSTGNFVSNQRRLMERAGALVLLDLVRDGGATRIAGASFVPTWVDIDGRGHRVTENRGKGWPGEALRQSLRLLPAGNRVSAAATRAVREGCSEASAGRPEASHASAR